MTSRVSLINPDVTGVTTETLLATYASLVNILQATADSTEFGEYICLALHSHSDGSLDGNHEDEYILPITDAINSWIIDECYKLIHAADCTNFAKGLLELWAQIMVRRSGVATIFHMAAFVDAESVYKPHRPTMASMTLKDRISSFVETMEPQQLVLLNMAASPHVPFYTLDRGRMLEECFIDVYDLQEKVKHYSGYGTMGSYRLMSIHKLISKITVEMQERGLSEGQ